MKVINNVQKICVQENERGEERNLCGRSRRKEMTNDRDEERKRDKRGKEESENERGRKERRRQTERETPPSRQLAGGKQAWE